MISPTLLLITIAIALFISFISKRTYEVSELLEKTANFGLSPEVELPYVQTCKHPLSETNISRLNNKCLDLVKDDTDFISGKEVYLKCDESNDILILFSDYSNTILYGITYDSNNKIRNRNFNN